MSRRFHHKSSFGPGRRQPLDRNQRARSRFLIDQHHRARRLTRAARDIGFALVKRVGLDGRCDPSYETLAADAACCSRTAERACASMRRLGLLSWERRLIRIGPYVEQTSNAYVLHQDKSAFPAERIRDRQNVDGTLKESLIPASITPAPEAKEALTRLRIDREKALAQRWASRLEGTRR